MLILKQIQLHKTCTIFFIFIFFYDTFIKSFLHSFFFFFAQIIV